MTVYPCGGTAPAWAAQTRSQQLVPSVVWRDCGVTTWERWRYEC